MAKAYSTIRTALKAGDEIDDLIKLCNIKAFPDLGGVEETLESTDLQGETQAYISGVQEVESLEFIANYTPYGYSAISQLSGQELYYALEMGEGASHGCFRWRGTHSVHVYGNEVDGVREMVITVIPSSMIVKTWFTDADHTGDIVIEELSGLYFDDPELDGNVEGYDPDMYIFTDEMGDGNIVITEV